MPMNAVERAWRIAHDFTSALPRAQLALGACGEWNPLSPRGFRQLGEVIIDELALTGIATSSTRRPTLRRTLDSCATAAEELAGLGVDGAHADPEPLRVKSLRRRRFGPQDSAGLRQLWCIYAATATRRDRGWSGCTERVRESPLTRCFRGRVGFRTS